MSLETKIYHFPLFTERRIVKHYDDDKKKLLTEAFEIRFKIEFAARCYQSHVIADAVVRY